MLTPSARQWVGSVSISKGQLINPAIVPAGSLTAGMHAVAELLGVRPRTKFRIDRTLKDTSREERDITVAELDAFCDLSERFNLSAHFPERDGFLSLFAGDPGYAEVRVTAENAAAAGHRVASFSFPRYDDNPFSAAVAATCIG